jgi:hypothetical protein
VVGNWLSVASFLKLTVVVAVLVSTAVAQSVGYWPCSKENPQPNLQLKTEKHLFGELRDPSGAAFERSRVILRKKRKTTFVGYRDVTTDANGKFDLGLVGPGSYRFLPGPNRAWKQPKQVTCGDSAQCELQLVLESNPTDLPFAQCPIR